MATLILREHLTIIKFEVTVSAPQKFQIPCIETVSGDWDSSINCGLSKDSVVKGNVRHLKDILDIVQLLLISLKRSL